MTAPSSPPDPHLEKLDWERWVPLALVALACLPYLGVLQFGFVFDDHPRVLGNPYLTEAGLFSKLFTTHAWSFSPAYEPRYYRPVVGLWLWTLRHLAGLNSAVWHLATLAMHVIATVLVYRLTLRLTAAMNVAWLAGALFAVHPLHVETAAWISDIDDSLVTVLLLGAALLLLRGARRDWMLSILLYTVALFTKETALPFLLVLPFLAGAERASADHESMARARGWVKGLAPFGASAILYLLIRWRVLGFLAAGRNGVSLHDSLLTVPAALGFYLSKWLVPHSLGVFYELGIQSQWTCRIAASAIFFAGLLGIGVVIACQRRSWPLGVALAWTLLPLLPALDFRIATLGHIVHDRYLYTSSVGLCILSARLLLRATQRWGTAGRMTASAALIVALSSISFFQSLYWASDVLLQQRSVEIAPGNELSHLYFTMALADRGNWEKALEHAERALALAPADSVAQYYVGGSLYNLHRLPEAKAYLEKAATANIAPAVLLLARAQTETGEATAAEATLRRGADMNPRARQFHLQLAHFYLSKKDPAAAAREFREELLRDPGNPEAQHALQELTKP